MSTDPEAIFRKSYDEVLLFLKHQDDKINRVLTALAFLTTAGVALYVQALPKGVKHAELPTFAGGARADDYFFVVFIMGVALSVALSLVALDPTSFRPRFIGGVHSIKGSSVLFYSPIAHHSPEEWETRRSTTIKDFVDALHHDSYRLALRANHKVARFATANATVQLTVAALALLGVMRLNNATLHERWVIATAVLVVYVALPAVDLIYFLVLRFPDVLELRWDSDGHWSKSDTGRALRGAAFFLPFLAMSVTALLTHFSQSRPVTVALIGTLVIRLLARIESKRLVRWFPMAASVAATTGGAIAIWCG